MATKTPPPGEQTRNVGPLQMRAAFVPSSMNEENRTIEIQWTTGEKVLRNSWDGQFFEELSLDPKHVRMDRLSSGRAPFLTDHGGRSVSSVIGVIESASLGRARVRIAKDDPAADAVWNKMKQGILPNVSAGYRIHKFEKVEGSDPKIPTFRATDWEPHEISLVALPAETSAFIRSTSETDTNPCIFITRGEPHEERRTMTEEEKKAAELAKREADLKATEAVRAEATKAERERVAAINLVVRSLGADAPAFATKLVDSGADLNTARAQVLEELAKRSDATATTTHARFEITDDNQDKFIRGASAAMFERSGTVKLISEAKAKGDKMFAAVETDGGEFRGAGFADLARACLERRGVSTRNMYSKEALFAAAFALRSGGFSGTSDFAVLLENVMYKQLRAAYATQGNTWERWCGTDEVQDYRTSNRFDLGSFGTLDTKNENGEYKNKSIPDGAKKTLVTEDRGNIIGVTREMLINDDMGAMANLATNFGKSASKSIEVAAYDLLNLHSGLGPYMTGTTPFFDNTAYSNVSTGAALTAAALDLDRQKMRAQLDLSGNDFLDLNPAILLIHPTLETAARILNADQYDPAQTGLKTNSARGMFVDILSSPRLASVTTTKRYIFDGSKEAFKVVFLAGESRGPVMETQNGWRNDGVEWKCRCTFKVQGFDPKAALYNAGV
jgi:hypothetical protein